jgi:hypothetical protein
VFGIGLSRLRAYERSDQSVAADDYGFEDSGLSQAAGCSPMRQQAFNLNGDSL